MHEDEVDLHQTVSRLKGVIVRHRWWILCAFGAGTLVALVWLSIVSYTYRSEATLLVVQQQIPQRYVLPTTTTDIREALQATTQEVLSRARLLAIVEEFGLYEKQQTRLSPEAVLYKIRNDIAILPVVTESPEKKDVTAFKISFVATNPQLAQAVTSKLTSLFIEQNLETREHQATTTTNFLREQLEAVKGKLGEAEEQVRAFKMQHLGELPEQQTGNLAIMNSLQTQLQSTMTSLNRAEVQRQYLESLSEYRILAIGNDLARLKAEKAKLLDQYTPKHPSVVRLNEKIAETEASIEQVRDWLKSGEGGRLNTSTAKIPDGDVSLGQLRGQLEENRLEIETLSKDEKRLKVELEQYQRRLDATPVREQQLSGMLRNYEQLKTDYSDLLAKETQSQMAGDLEKRQEGQQFRLVDRPSLPTVPSSPNRIKVSLTGAAAGIGLGLALAFLLNLTDRSLHSEDDLRHLVELPLVVSVPLMLTWSEQRSRKRKTTLEWVAASGLILAALLAQLYEFYLYKYT